MTSTAEQGQSVTLTPTIGHVIRCPRTAGLALFEPTRQLLTFCNPAGDKVELSYSASRILELLIQKTDTIVTREDILAYAWPGRIVTQSSLNQAISSVREQLGDEISKDIIQTMPRRGYQFNSRFLARPEEWPVNDNIAKPDACDAAPQPTIVMRENKRLSRPCLPAHIWLLMVIALLLGLLIWRINWCLLLEPGLATNNQQSGDNRLIYTAPDEAQLPALETEMAPLRQKLLDLSQSPVTLLFNRTYNFYDVICISQTHRIYSIFVHKSQLSRLTDDQFRECLQ
jgi:cholera toxin transcriptional activator